MSLLSFTQPCQITNRTQTGDEEVDDGWEEESPVDAFFYHEPISSEELATRIGGRATERAWFPIDTDIDIHARVETTDEGWEIEGPPRRWRSPITALAYIECDMVEVDPVFGGES